MSDEEGIILGRHYDDITGRAGEKIFWLFGLLCGRILVASGLRRPMRQGKARFDCAPKMGRFSAWTNPFPNRRFWMASGFPDFGFARGSSSMSAIQPAW